MRKNIRVLLIIFLFPALAGISFTITAMKKQKKKNGLTFEKKWLNEKTVVYTPEVRVLKYLLIHGKLYNLKYQPIFEDEIESLRWFIEEKKHLCTCLKYFCTNCRPKNKRIIKEQEIRKLIQKVSKDKPQGPKLLPSLTTPEMWKGKSPKPKSRNFPQTKVTFYFIDSRLYRKNGERVSDHGDIDNLKMFVLPGWNPQYSKARELSCIHKYRKTVFDFKAKNGGLIYKASTAKKEKIRELNEKAKKLNTKYKKEEKAMSLAVVAEFMRIFHS